MKTRLGIFVETRKTISVHILIVNSFSGVWCFKFKEPLERSNVEGRNVWWCQINKLKHLEFEEKEELTEKSDRLDDH